MVVGICMFVCVSVIRMYVTVEREHGRAVFGFVQLRHMDVFVLASALMCIFA